MRPVRQYRAASIDVLAGWLARHPDEETRWRLIAEFLEEYRHEQPETRLGLLSAEPSSVGDSRWDVFLAALAEHLAAQEGQAGPAWTETRRLRQFWFPFNSPAARVDAFVHAPASFRRRGVFIHPQELEVA
ncbi:hypothetical protein ACFHYQ_09595 [Sphaerimonospora cavernae]|uniref:CdiI immunity protein domain-containing protein n=1 Tax=Sphaerimonospora cavernae TaxID=1740611 RepID=A0ABV6U266_9ACTN